MKIRYKFKIELYSIHKHLLSSFLDKLCQKNLRKSFSSILVLLLKRQKNGCLERLNAAYKLSTLDKVLIRHNNERHLMLKNYKCMQNQYHLRRKRYVDKQVLLCSLLFKI